MPYAQRDELRLYYERDVSGDPELLFAHGWCCDHTFFQPQVDHFKPFRTVTTFDTRGCGRSSGPQEGYDLPSLADDLAWLCAEIGIARPIVVGHSSGAMVAIELAARYPSLPRAVVAVDPGPIHPIAETVAIYEGFVTELAGPAAEDVRRAWVEDCVGPTAGAALRQKIVAAMCAVPLSVATAAMRGIAAWNGVAALALCEVPTLLLRSGPEESDDNELARLFSLKPDLHVGVTVGAGHFHQLEVPEQVTPMIERFLDVAIAEPS
jgi:pimeloyl-ACP methyl ester carboxylesterase